MGVGLLRRFLNLIRVVGLRLVRKVPADGDYDYLYEVEVEPYITSEDIDNIVDSITEYL